MFVFLLFLLGNMSLDAKVMVKEEQLTPEQLYELIQAELDQKKKLSLLSQLAWQIHYSDTAQIYYNAALELARELGDKNTEAQNLNRLGVLYRNVDLQEDAVKLYEEALLVAKSAGDFKELGFAYNNIAQINFYQELYSEALDYYADAEKAFKSKNHLDGLGYTYTGMSAVYGKMEKYSEAVELINKAITIREKLDQERQLLISIYNRGQLFLQMGNMLGAEADISSFLKYALIHDTRGANHALGKLGEVYFRTDRLNHAIEACNQAIELNETAASIEGMVAIYDLLYRIHLEKSNPEQARIYLDNLADAKNKLNEEKTRISLLGVTVRKQKDDIAALHREKILIQKNEQFKMIIAYVLLGMVMALYIALAIYYRSFHREKMNLLKLQEQKSKIEKQAQELDRLNLVKDKIFSILAHDLRGPLYSLQGLVQLIQEDNLTQDEFESYIPLISQNLGNNSLLLENLLVWSRSQMKGMEARVSKIALHDLVQKNIEFLIGSSYFKEQIIINQVPDQVHVKADKNMLEIIIRNLLTNAMKFTRKDDVISIQVEEEADHYTIGIVDQGIGISEEGMNKLFGTDFFTTPGTHLEKGTGIGLLLTQELVQKNKGKIWAKSVYGKGSTFSFTLPRY